MSQIYISALAREIAETLSNYSDEVTEKVRSAADEVAKLGVKQLRLTSPKRPGRGYYAKGWTVKTTGSAKIIHNRTNYQLTHLLEHGHAKAGGGRVSGKPHIGPTEEMVIQEFTRKTEEAISNG